MKDKNKENTSGVLISHGREINYLRVSVTDRCNMRCVYCMPEDVKFLPVDEILSYEEIDRVVRVAVDAGIRKVRLTGGEPLARRGIDGLVRSLAAQRGIEDLSLTTNGLLLSEAAASLSRAGLQRVNVSLDTLDSVQFSKICRAGRFEDVIEGIREANRRGLSPVKVNVVVMRGRNELEIADFLDFSIRENVIVRFIEYMPIKQDGDWEKRYVPRDEMLAQIKGRVEPCGEVGTDPNAPARYYDVVGTDVRVGFISPVSHGFCSNCNRLRLTPEGRLLSCLLSDAYLDLKKILRSGGADSEIADAFREVVAMKGKKGNFREAKRSMHSTGG